MVFKIQGFKCGMCGSETEHQADRQCKKCHSADPLNPVYIIDSKTRLEGIKTAAMITPAEKNSPSNCKVDKITVEAERRTFFDWFFRRPFRWKITTQYEKA